MQEQSSIKEPGFSIPGKPATFIPNTPVKNESGKKIAVTMESTYIR